MSITTKDLLPRISRGEKIRWAGTVNDLPVVMMNDAIRTTLQVNIATDLSAYYAYEPTLSGECIGADPVLCPHPPGGGDLESTRAMSVLGLNIGGFAKPMNAPEYVEIEGCTCGYDIELDLRNETRDGFPLPDVAIISIAMWCTCGYVKFLTTLESDSDAVVQCSGSQGLVSAFMSEMMEHMPLWLVGWNCYAFDNTCMFYHCQPEYERAFMHVKVGSAAEANYGYIMNIPGVYNVDPYQYMLRNPAHNSRHTDLSLYGVAKALGTRHKTDMPNLYTTPPVLELMEYNINDCAVAVEIWIKSDLVIEIPSLALIMSSPVYDAIRYVSGTLAACSYAAVALTMNRIPNWTTPRDTYRYEGGYVMEPSRGLHRNVTICDFSSMYPSIMMYGNISPESVSIYTSTEVDTDEHEYGDVWWNDECTMWGCQLDGRIAIYNTTVTSVVGASLSEKVRIRNTVKKTKPAYAGALKVGSNSLYGGMGYKFSPLYSPACSSTVTSVGRWLLRRAAACMEQVGLCVIYGDTDSVFCKPVDDTLNEAASLRLTTEGLRLLHAELETTPFRGIAMELESYHPSVLLVDKKHYCKLNRDNTVTYKGVSVVRRDVVGIAKVSCRIACDTLLRSTCSADVVLAIGSYIAGIVEMHRRGMLTFDDVSRRKKIDQRLCYVYTDSAGHEATIPVDFAYGITPSYDATVIFKKVASEMNRYLHPAGYDNLWSIMMQYPFMH